MHSKILLANINHKAPRMHEDFAIYLLRDFEHEGATVMLAPATGFNASPLGHDEVRIAYVLKEEDLRRSVELLRIALEPVHRPMI